MAESGNPPQEYGQYAKMLRRKQRDYERETMPFSEMTERDDITGYLEGFAIYDAENEETIRPNDTQKHDLNLVLQKRYHLLQWEQGPGRYRCAGGV